ncbi:MAG: sensor histidine kinase [Gemmatimonadota bacterium]
MANSLQDCPLAAALAQQLRSACRDLTGQWLERVAQRVSIDRNRIFPTNDLLDHVPLLIGGIADYLENPAEAVSINTPVVAKAMELGALRHQQGFDAHEILKEYEILGGIMFNHLAHAADEMPEPCAKSELLVCGYRLFRAITIIQQTTTAHYLRLADELVAEREARLRTFNRAVSHEIKNRIGAVLGASDLILETKPAPDQVDRLLEVIARNARAMNDVVQDLLALSRMEKDVRQHRHIRLPQAIQEACRQVRDASQGAQVVIRCVGDLPDVEVNAAAVELCLTNYLGNSIKYFDPAKQARFAEIRAAIETVPGSSLPEEVVVRVHDNGLGVPAPKRSDLFKLFFRAHETVTGTEGTGLGLSIVRDAAESLGGRAWAEFTEEGSIFAFSVPFRRGESDRRSVSPAETAEIAQ